MFQKQTPPVTNVTMTTVGRNLELQELANRVLNASPQHYGYHDSEEKLSSIKMMSEASLATSVPVRCP